MVSWRYLCVAYQPPHSKGADARPAQGAPETLDIHPTARPVSLFGRPCQTRLRAGDFKDPVGRSMSTHYLTPGLCICLLHCLYMVLLASPCSQDRKCRHSVQKTCEQPGIYFQGEDEVSVSGDPLPLDHWYRYRLLLRKEVLLFLH